MTANGNGEALDAARSEAIAADRCFSKGRLRDEFRMKPKAGAAPVKFYKNGYGGKFGVYRIADCIPLRDRQGREPTDALRRASQLLALRSRLISRLAWAGLTARGWLAEPAVFLDTETTGLDGSAQVIELAVLDAAGETLFESRLRPSVPIEPGAFDVHGISEAMLQDAPTWLAVAAPLAAVLADRDVVIFNAEFDMRMLRQTASAFGDRADWLATVRPRCAMELAADAYCATNSSGTISLARAMIEAGVAWVGAAHGARADSRAVLDLVKGIAAYRADLEAQCDILASPQTAMPDPAAVSATEDTTTGAA